MRTCMFIMVKDMIENNIPNLVQKLVSHPRTAVDYHQNKTSGYNSWLFPFVVFLRYNLMFSLTGGGKYNFLGTKRWIEENLDHAGEFFYKCVGFGTYAVSNMCCYTTNISEHEQPSLIYFIQIFPLQSPACSMTMWHLFCVWIHWPTVINCMYTCPALLNLTLPCTISFSSWRR